MSSPSLVRSRASDESLLAQRTEPQEHGLSVTQRARSAPDRGPSSDGSLALRLTDDQLTEIMRLCRPLALPCRDALLRILAHELRGRRDVGDGGLHRIARTIIKDNCLFDPPLETEPQHRRVGKYARVDGEFSLGTSTSKGKTNDC
jgi:hypothetical protein